MTTAGLQVQRYGAHAYGCEKDMKGQYVRFSDYNTLHESMQILAGRNMKLSAELIELKDELTLVENERDELREQKERAEYLASKPE